MASGTPGCVALYCRPLCTAPAASPGCGALYCGHGGGGGVCLHRDVTCRIPPPPSRPVKDSTPSDPSGCTEGSRGRTGPGRALLGVLAGFRFTVAAADVPGRGLFLADAAREAGRDGEEEEEERKAPGKLRIGAVISPVPGERLPVAGGPARDWTVWPPFTRASFCFRLRDDRRADGASPDVVKPDVRGPHDSPGLFVLRADTTGTVPPTACLEPAT
ncbi:unnamed protein product [Gadus morhua 'NCC']